MQVAQKWGSFFYTYTQCTKIEPCDQFVGKLGNNLQNSLDFSLRVRGERSCAEGTQRGSNATPLRVPARGGVWLI
nr:MAG TPA: hypothetical protein [Caudoviricetes sp.]